MAEHQIVDLVVVGSSPIWRPKPTVKLVLA